MTLFAGTRTATGTRTAADTRPATEIGKPAHPRPLGHLVPIRALDAGEDLLHVAIGLILFVIAIVVLVHSIQDLANAKPLFPGGVITGINDVLFIVIILEILRTVTSHFTEGGGSKSSLFW